MGVALRHLNHVIGEVAPDAPLVFCGDFNSCPDSGNSTCDGILKKAHPPSRWTVLMDSKFLLLLSPGVFQLVTETKIPEQHTDWSSSGSEESCNIELLSTFPPLMSACNRPSYTNYVGGFHGCLDYIFIQPESMQVWTLAVLTV